MFADARRRRASANIGREDLALNQPARSTDTDRERGDEEGETHHHHSDLRRAGQGRHAQRRDHHEHRHARVAPQGQWAAAELVDPTEPEVGRDHVDRTEDGRRPLALWGYAGMAVFMVIAALGVATLTGTPKIAVVMVGFSF